MSKRTSLLSRMLRHTNERVSKYLLRGAVTAYADDGGELANPSDGGNKDANNDGGNGGAPQVNFEDLISKARADEKKKQYGKIEKLTTENNDLVSKNNELLLKVGQLETQLDEANKKLVEAGKGDSEEVITLKTEIANLKKDLESAQAEVKKFTDNPPANEEEIEKRLRGEIEKEFEVKLYRAEKIAPYANDPTVVTELITGETKEDIDATLKAALDRSKSIRKSLGLNSDGTSDQRRSNPVAVQPLNPAMDNGGGSSMGGEDILAQLASLDPRSPEYAKLRKEAGLG